MFVQQTETTNYTQWVTEALSDAAPAILLDPHQKLQSQDAVVPCDAANEISIDKVEALFVAPDRTQPTSFPPQRLSAAAHDVTRATLAIEVAIALNKLAIDRRSHINVVSHKKLSCTLGRSWEYESLRSNNR